MTTSITPAMELNKRINELRHEHKKETKKLNKSFNKIIDSKDEVNNDKLKGMKKAQESELAKASENFHTQLDKNKNQFSSKITSERDAMKEKIQDVKQDKTDQLQEQLKQFKKEEEKVRQTYENIIKDRDLYSEQKDQQFKDKLNSTSEKLNTKIRNNTNEIVKYSQQQINKNTIKSKNLLKGQSDLYKNEIENLNHNKLDLITNIKTNNDKKIQEEAIKFKESLNRANDTINWQNIKNEKITRKELRNIKQNSSFEQKRLKEDFKSRLNDINVEFRKILSQKDLEMKMQTQRSKDLIQKNELRHLDEIQDLKDYYEEKFKELTVDHGLEKLNIIRKMKEENEEYEV